MGKRIGTFRYDILGNVTAVSDALGNTTSTIYNLAGQAEYITYAETAARRLAYTVRYTYNGLGQKVKENYDGAEYTYTYDGAGNRLSTQLDGITKSSAVYDLLGRTLSATDGRGYTTYYKRNVFGKVSESLIPWDSIIALNRTIYQYDVLGNLVYSKDSLGAVTRYTYDNLGRRMDTAVSVESGTQSITTHTHYDLNSNVTYEKDGNGNVTEYRYDGLNRRTGVTNAVKQVLR